jgi:hypothetical protein
MNDTTGDGMLGNYRAYKRGISRKRYDIPLLVKRALNGLIIGISIVFIVLTILSMFNTRITTILIQSIIGGIK